MVIGIDMSNILDQAEKIVRSNGFTEDRKFCFSMWGTRVESVSETSVFSLRDRIWNGCSGTWSS